MSFVHEIFHSVDAVDMLFGKRTMSKNGLMIRRKYNQKCIDNWCIYFSILVIVPTLQG